MINLEENNIYFYFNKHKLRENFNKFSRLGDVYYPLKTNSNEAVLTEMKHYLNNGNNGFLISSLSHFEILKKINVEASKMCFINVLAEDETIKYLYDNGVRFFTFDNFDSLMAFSKYANLKEVKVLVRLSTTQIYNDKYSHLGASLEESKKMFEFLKSKCNDYGISFYIQKNIKDEENVLEKILEYIKKNYNNQGINFVTIGGVKSSEDISQKMIKKLKTDLKIAQVILEVGRYLVEDTIDMETRIIREKIINNQKTVIIKNGIYSGFLDILLYDKKFSLYLKSKEDGEIKIKHEKTNASDYEFSLCGGSSDSADKLGLMYIDSKYKDELKVGNKLYVKNVGAYFEEFFMPYSDDLKKVIVEV